MRKSPIHWIKYLTAKEKIKYLLLLTGTRFTNRSFFKSFIDSLKQSVAELRPYKFKICRKGNSLQVIKGNTKYFLRILTSDILVFNQVILNEEYGSVISVFSNNGLKSPKVIIDAGANGMTTLFFRDDFPYSKIILVEPEKDNFKQLTKNISENHLETSTLLLNKALWTNNSGILYISNEFRDGTSWAKAVTMSPCETQSVSAIDLASIFRLIDNFSAIDILKMDIEGAESVLFTDVSFLEQLKKHVRVLCLEIHEELQDKHIILNILNTLNFSFEIKRETVFAINQNLVTA